MFTTQVHVYVTDYVLHLYAASLEVDAWDRLAQNGCDLVRCEDTEQEVATAREDHLTRRKQLERLTAVWVEQAVQCGSNRRCSADQTGEWRWTRRCCWAG